MWLVSTLVKIATEEGDATTMTFIKHNEMFGIYFIEKQVYDKESLKKLYEEICEILEKKKK